MPNEEDLDRWARLRFAIIGPLLAAPPKAGALRQALEALASKSWTHPVSERTHEWTERVLVARSSAYQAGLRRRRERTLTRLSHDLAKFQSGSWPVRVPSRP